MPIFYMPDNTPSRNYGRNSRTEGYAHPAHGTPGALAKSDTDPRNRGRKRSREEIEDSSRARYAEKRERLDKLREGVETKKAADKEAKETKDKMINEAREQAKVEAAKIVTDAQAAIQSQKMAALTDVKNQIGNMVIEISEKVIRKQLDNKAEQEKYIQQMAGELHQFGNQ